MGLQRWPCSFAKILHSPYCHLQRRRIGEHQRKGGSGEMTIALLAIAIVAVFIVYVRRLQVESAGVKWAPVLGIAFVVLVVFLLARIPRSVRWRASLAGRGVSLTTDG